jgi:hypothetical protein
VGLYLRKSFRAGPVRFNLSKSGIGVSAGVKGFRVGVGPRGNYVHAGRNGFYYRASLPSGQSERLSSPGPEQAKVGQAPPRAISSDALTEIDSGSVHQMVDSLGTTLLAELNAKHKQRRIWPWVLGVTVLLTLSGSATVLGLGLLATWGAAQWDRVRRATVLTYDLDDVTRALSA